MEFPEGVLGPVGLCILGSVMAIAFFSMGHQGITVEEAVSAVILVSIGIWARFYKPCLWVAIATLTGILVYAKKTHKPGWVAEIVEIIVPYIYSNLYLMGSNF